MNNSKNVLVNKPKSQIPMAIFVLIITVIVGIFLFTLSKNLLFYWITGIAFGFILQKSRFCFAAAFRDPYLIGNTSLTKAVLVAFALTTVGFTAIKYIAFIQGDEIPGYQSVMPISFATIVGGLIFGIGMVLAGGCASGMLMRIGEGFQLQLITLLFFIIGSLLGAHDFEWWYDVFISKGKSIFLPDILGWFGALFIQILFIAILYIIADKWESKKNHEL